MKLAVSQLSGHNRSLDSEAAVTQRSDEKMARESG
jgi:hypothetical protein